LRSRGPEDKRSQGKTPDRERDRGHEDKKDQKTEGPGEQRTGTQEVLKTYRDEDMENRGQKWKGPKGVSLYDVGKVT
jgi:hypothetical protein